MKTSIDPTRVALNGPTMGTRWSALFHTAPGHDTAPIAAELQAAVDVVDAQMSTYKPQSALMRFNATPAGTWLQVPEALATVLRLGITIGQASGGAFEIGMGDAVTAWGFGPEAADTDRIRNAISRPRVAAAEALEFDGAQLRKRVPIALDLNGIAKGYGVDCLAAVLAAHGIKDALVGIDGEMRALGLRPDGQPWNVAVEAPDTERRSPHSILALQDASVATSGDYRHWVEVQGRRLSHTMDPRRGAPLIAPPNSVTIVARTCAEADAWATAMMVLGPERGKQMALQHGLNALFLTRDEDGIIQDIGVGPLFAPDPNDAAVKR